MSISIDPAAKRPYRGRFAPSPSGPLHFGSLIAALGSYLDAKANHGAWLVRMEDIDTPRVVKGAESDILHTLEAYGLHWDESVIYQSQRHSIYQDIIQSLINQQYVYGCHCTRKQIKAIGGIYQSHCKTLGHCLNTSALRLTQNHPIESYQDLIQGEVKINSALAHEDYIIKRSDGLYAYQLVVVADDIAQGITRVVRGADLLEPTARQISLFKQLGQPVPEYAHLPLAVSKPGLKLSKQNHAPAIDKKAPATTLMRALSFLGFEPPTELALESVETILNWAIKHYSLHMIANKLEIAVPIVNEKIDIKKD